MNSVNIAHIENDLSKMDLQHSFLSKVISDSKNTLNGRLNRKYGTVDREWFGDSSGSRTRGPHKIHNPPIATVIQNSKVSGLPDIDLKGEVSL